MLLSFILHNMALLTVPNELLLIIAENLVKRPEHVNSLLLSNRRLASLLTPLLYCLAVQDKDGWTALQWAAQRGHETLAELVLSKGADVNAMDNFFGQSAFYLAVKNRHVGLIGILLANGADMSLDGELRRIALNWAAREGRADVVELLLERGPERGCPFSRRSFIAPSCVRWKWSSSCWTAGRYRHEH